MPRVKTKAKTPGWPLQSSPSHPTPCPARICASDVQPNTTPAARKTCEPAIAKAFRGSQITEVTLPASLERVGRYAFAFSRVATITFVPGASGAYVGAYAFRQCPVARTSVSVLASMPPSIAGRFSRLAFYYEDARRRSRAAVWGGEIEVVLE